MKYWERFLNSLFRLLAQRRMRRLKPKLIEAVLAKSVFLLDAEMPGQIRNFVAEQQSAQGGFKDRAGKCDLYYTLFGFYLAEALQVKINHEQLAGYVRKSAEAPDLAGVHLYCAAILYARLMGNDDVSEKLRKRVVAGLKNHKAGQPDYTGFMGMLALYYLGDFMNISRIVHRFRHDSQQADQPCPVIAARSVLQSFSGKASPDASKNMMAFYRANGGFAALQQAPAEDLLSTAVALFALHFFDADIRVIKPACLSFVDALYHQGGFMATHDDTQPDIEYTFYGMLALGSMN
jgi:hypothetical protein